MISAIDAQQSLNFKTAPKYGKGLARQVIHDVPKGLTSSPACFDLEKEFEKSPFLQGVFGATWFSVVAATFLKFTSIKFGS